MNRNIEQGISDIVGCLIDPIVVFPGGWGDTIPEWLKTAITLERTMGNMKVLKGEEPVGTDAEACVYLYTASLAAPMDNDWSQIYLYVATETLRRWGKGVMPDDVHVDSITGFQRGKLNHLKVWLYHQRIIAREERKKSQPKNSEKGRAIKQEELEQPALFKF